jgi:hypothetical protein
VVSSFLNRRARSQRTERTVELLRELNRARRVGARDAAAALATDLSDLDRRVDPRQGRMPWYAAGP